MSRNKTGACMVSLSQPMGATRFLGATRFYGPFDNSDQAEIWIDLQPEQTRDYFWVVPLRRTDIERTHDDFYNPSNDGYGTDFWN